MNPTSRYRQWRKESHWKGMFLKYATIVAEHEGVYFLDECDWSKKDWKVICEGLNLERDS